MLMVFGASGTGQGHQRHSFLQSPSLRTFPSHPDGVNTSVRCADTLLFWNLAQGLPSWSLRSQFSGSCIFCLGFGFLKEKLAAHESILDTRLLVFWPQKCGQNSVCKRYIGILTTSWMEDRRFCPQKCGQYSSKLFFFFGTLFTWVYAEWKLSWEFWPHVVGKIWPSVLDSRLWRYRPIKSFRKNLYSTSYWFPQYM
jgi:hypothetical protein